MRGLRGSISVVIAVGAVLFGSLPATGAGGTKPTPPDQGYDWSTYGFNLERTGYNDQETTLGTSNVASLHQLWSFDLGAVTVGQPVSASGVLISGSPTDVVYTGTEHGDFYALNANTGQVIWQRNLGSTQTSCFSTPDAVFGVSGAATFDRVANRIYVAGGTGRVYALDMSTGDTASGWPLKVISQPTLNHVWGALALSAGKLYVPVGGLCDLTPYHGHLAEIDVSTAKEIENWIVNLSYSGPSGGAIWGYGGVSVKDTTGNVFTATGNAIGSNEHYGFSEHVVKLDSSLVVQDSNYPGLTGTDVDFGSTPMLYRPDGCKDKLVVMNKTGQLFVYNRTSIGSGPFQTLQISKRGVFIGVVAYSPATNMLYVPNPNTSTSGTYKHGLVALSVGSDCKLSLAWQKSVGANGSSVASPTVANGVVYFGDGQSDQVFAFNASTGAQLWSSGTQITGSVYAAPMVADGKLFVGAWDDRLYAFAPS